MKIRGERRKLLKILAEYDHQVTPQELLKKIESDEVEDKLYSSDKSINNALKKLSETDDGSLPPVSRNEDGGKPYKYEITEEGEKKIKSWKETKQVSDTSSENLGYGEAVRIFEEYFSEEIYDKVASAIQSGQSYVEVDLMNLDVFHPELYEHIRNNPDTAIEAAEEGLQGVDLITDEEPEVRFYNLDEEDKIALSELSHSQNIGKYVSAEGVVIYNRRTLPEIVAGIFECSQCGDRYRKEQDSSKLKSPYKCDCGSRKFELVEKILTDSKVLRIQERASNSNRRKIDVRVQGELAKNDELEKTSLGSLIKVNGVVREKPLKKNSKKYDTYIEANSIEFKDKNRLEEIDEDTKDRVKELSEDPEIKEKLKQTVARGAVGGLNRVKEAYLIYRLGKTKDGNVHLLIAGEPGVGKSLLGDISNKTLPRTIYTVLKGTTEKGLTVSFDTEDGEEQEYRAGDLVECDDGFFIGDEAGKFNGDYNVFNTPMQQEMVNRSATGRKVSLPASVSVCLITNPVKTEDGRKWDKGKDNPPSIEQLPLREDTDTLSRFDIQLAIPKQKIEDSGSVRRELMKAEKVLKNAEDIETEIEIDVYKAYLSVAEDIEPKIPPACKELLRKIYIGLSLKDYTTSPRVLESLKKLSKAYARIRLEKTVSQERVIEAYEFWRNCRATLYDGFRVKDDEDDEQVSEETGFETVQVVKLAEIIEIVEENAGRISKEDLKQELDLGGSPTKQEEVFAELVEEALESDALREENDDVVLERDSGFLENHEVKQLLQDSVFPETEVNSDE